MRAELADGRILEFPDGTDPAVIQSTVKRMLGQPEQQPIIPAPTQQIDTDQVQPVAPAIAAEMQEPQLGQPGGLVASLPEIGGEEALGTVASGIVAEPVAGLAGLVSAPFVGAEQATKNIESVREALTFIPKTESGMAKLQQIAEILQPVGEAVEAAEEVTAEAGFEAAGPVGAAIGATVPTAAMTALGAGSVRRALGLSKIAKVGKNLVTTGAKKLLTESAPTIEGLKTAARGVYDELDNIGITINPGSVNRLSNELRSVARQSGFNKKIHPKVSAALSEFQTVRNSPQSLTEIDTLRKVMQGAASSIEPSEARIGSILIGKIDDTLDNLKGANFVNPTKADIGAKFRDARQLWRRAKKSELLEESFEKARLQATGFENGIRVQFRSILNNKKKRRGFTSEEIDAMTQVVKGGTAENIAKMIGRFGFSEGQASNMLMGSLGVAGGAAVGGAPGAVAVPLIGQLSRKLAQKLTRAGAEATDVLIRAGNEGDDIVKAYLKITKPEKRNAADLTELLLRPNVSLDKLKAKVAKLPKNKKNIAADALFFVSAIQSQKNKPEVTEEEKQ